MIRKICGIETEYGIHIKGMDPNPVLASSLLINAYLQQFQSRAGWDFLAEHPEIDARGLQLIDVLPPEVETHLVNAVLTNGARYYVDHAHPEISTPECASPLDVVLYDRAAEEIVRESMQLARNFLPRDAELLVYKNNSDGKGNSYGCHENYLVDRSLDFQQLVSAITPHFVTRQIFCGSGKIGVENLSARRGPLPTGELTFQLSQRADFFEAEVGLETTLKRPIVNTRDEPHCDPRKYRRLHVICGDANMSEIATFLKVASTAVVLAMAEDGLPLGTLALADPIKAVQAISVDVDLSSPVELRTGEQKTALEIQMQLCQMSIRYLESNPECIGDESAQLLVKLWPEILSDLASRSDNLATLVDWCAKKRMLEAYAERHDLSGDHPRLRLIDLQYHDMREDKCLAHRAGLKTLVEARGVLRAKVYPPSDTRAWFRGMCLKTWPESVVAANWDSLILDVGDGDLRRIQMMEPMKGTEAIVGHLFDQASSPSELLQKLGQ